MKFSMLFSLILFFSYNAFAFKVSPIELNFEPKGARSVRTIKVENTTKSKIPIEIFAYERVHVRGKEKRLPTNDFYFFPKQLILKPGEKRNIRLSWMGLRAKGKKINPMKKGNTNLKKEKAYRLEIKQVPVNLKKKASKTGITFLYNYVASLYVTPPKSKASLKVVNYRSLGRNMYWVNVQNSGTAHAILPFYYLIGKKAGRQQFKLDMKKQSDDVSGVNLLPGEVRGVKLKILNNIESGGMSLEFKKRG